MGKIIRIKKSSSNPGVTPFGIAYKRPDPPMHNISYDLYDEGWQLANGTYNYTPPSNPESLAELDLISINPFLTLKNNNAFGNKNRFTDENGLQVYGNDYLVDNLTGLGWHTKWVGSSVLVGTDLYNNHLTAANIYVNGLSMNDFRCPNQNEQLTLFNFSLLNDRATMNYPPFNYTIGHYMMSSTTTPQNAGTSLNFNSPVNVFGYVGTNNVKTTRGCVVFYVRNHFN